MSALLLAPPEEEEVAFLGEVEEEVTLFPAAAVEPVAFLAFLLLVDAAFLAGIFFFLFSDTEKM